MSNVIITKDINGFKQIQLIFDTPDSATQPQEVTYRIFLEKDEEGNYIVTCPDLQGVVTWGETEDKAIENAYEAVQAMLEARKMNEKFNLIAIIKS